MFQVRFSLRCLESFKHPNRLRALLPQLSVEFSDKYGLPVDAKEAIAFALLADRTLQGLPGNLPSVTGARRAVVPGKIVRP